VYLERSYELHQRQGNTGHTQMFMDVGVCYTLAFIFHGKEFNSEEFNLAVLCPKHDSYVGYLDFFLF
jgi:hypothetical protein